MGGIPCSLRPRPAAGLKLPIESPNMPCILCSPPTPCQLQIKTVFFLSSKDFLNLQQRSSLNCLPCLCRVKKKKKIPLAALCLISVTCLFFCSHLSGTLLKGLLSHTLSSSLGSTEVGEVFIYTSLWIIR